MTMNVSIFAFLECYIIAFILFVVYAIGVISLIFCDFDPYEPTHKRRKKRNYHSDDFPLSEPWNGYSDPDDIPTDGYGNSEY